MYLLYYKDTSNPFFKVVDKTWMNTENISETV